MSRIARSRAARRDVKALALYIGRYDESAVGRLLARIDEKLRLLADNPDLGAMWSDGARGLRSFTASPYILYYRPIPGGIRLVRVLHGARDAGTVLRED